MLRYAADRRTVIAVLSTLLVMLWTYTQPLSWRWLLYIPLLSVASLICCVINHNHVHCLTFRRPWANRLFEFLLTLTRGHTSATIWLPHNHNHHRHSGSNDDWITPNHVAHRQDLLSLLQYIGRSMRTMRQRRLNEEGLVPPSIKRRQKQEQLILYVFMVTLITGNPVQALFAFGLPWFLGAALLVAVNLYQHALCSTTNLLQGSRNFLNPVENWFFFNNGYHTAHHLSPNLHWSQLPAAHAKIVKKIPDHLDQGSIVLYSLKHLAPSKQLSAPELLNL